MPLVQVQLLGSARASVGDRTVAFLPDKRYLLLAYLACRDEWVGREELAHLFWPDVPDTRARHRLRQLLKRVRQVDWPVDLEADLHRVRWEAATDVVAVRSALADGADEVAVRLYGGPLLQAFDGACPQEYHRWLEFERRDLHEGWRAGVVRHGRRLEDRGLPGEAAELYARVLAHDPFDEEVARARMRALAAAGDADRALRTWSAFAEGLRVELGVEPSEASRRHVAEIARAAPDGDDEAAAQPTEALAPRPTPLPTSPFVGREVELAEVAHRLSRPECRLLTIMGPGGVGKSRLAARAADELRHRYPDGAHVVPLERARTIGDLLALVAAALSDAGDDSPPRPPHLPIPAHDDPLAALRDLVRRRRMLLVLDGFEHLAAEARALLGLIADGPHVDLLVTSRHRLGLDAEWLLPIEGMPWPPPTVGTVDEALAYDGARLFVACAGRRGAAPPGPGDLPYLSRICAAVRGVPLALELAAAWARALPLRAIAERIERDLDFLGGPDADAGRPASGRTGAVGPDDPRPSGGVRAAFDHSWALLREAERDAFARLAVFPGRFRASAAEAVAGVRLPILVALIDKSLLRLEPDGRYDRHPLLRQYAAERLAERPDDAAALGERHTRFTLAEAEAIRPKLAGPDEAAALWRLDALHDDVRAALRWCAERGDGEKAVRLCAALGRYWEVRGLTAEGLELIEQALALPTSRPRASARAAALNAAGLLAWARNEYARASAAFEAALELRRTIRDRRGAAATLNNLGGLAADRGDLERARGLHRASLALKRALGDERGVAMSLNNLGIVSSMEGDHAAARASFERSLAAMRACNHHEGTVMTLNNLGLEAEHEGDLVDALARFEEGLALARGLGVQIGVARLANNLGRIRRWLGDRAAARSHLLESLRIRWRIGSRLGVADTLEEIAGLELDAGDAARATALWGVAAALRDAVGASGTTLRSYVSDDQERARTLLGAVEFAAGVARGRALPLERVLQDLHVAGVRRERAPALQPADGEG